MEDFEISFGLSLFRSLPNITIISLQFIAFGLQYQSYLMQPSEDELQSVYLSSFARTLFLYKTYLYCTLHFIIITFCFL